MDKTEAEDSGQEVDEDDYLEYSDSDFIRKVRKEKYY